MAEIPRLLFAAPASGSGKTTFTCGFLKALQNRGLRPASFKCGPDYIDPMFHRSVLGLPGRNLDLFFTSEGIVRGLLLEGAKRADIAVLEGVMGYYDGLGAAGAEASSYHVAAATKTPVVLVVNAKGASLSVAATIKGFAEFRPDAGIVGAVLNNCGEALYTQLAPAIEAQIGVKAFGFVPPNPDFSIGSRHLGLLTAEEVEGLGQKLEGVARQLEASVDIDGLLAAAKNAPPLEGALPEFAGPEGEGPVIAVARDRAFCFYYEENLRLLEAMGAELVCFSPLADSALPEKAAGLYLGGGYPELHAGALSGNTAMREAVRRAVAGGMPTLAECGGFMYLQQTLADDAGDAYPVAGALPGHSAPTGKLRRFGYCTLTARRDTLLCRAGERVRAHEFHYWDSDACGDGFLAQKPTGSRSWECVQAGETLHAGYPHLYFWSNPGAAANLVNAAAVFAARGPDQQETPRDDRPPTQP